MRPLSFFFAFSFFTVFSFAFLFQPQIPAELQGKWKLRATLSKLIGIIEIRSDGKYNYTVSPGYKETGYLKINSRIQPFEINLIVSRVKERTDTTRGVYRITNNQLTLCLGKINGPRPKGFENNSVTGSILWTGSK